MKINTKLLKMFDKLIQNNSGKGMEQSPKKYF